MRLSSPTALLSALLLTSLAACSGAQKAPTDTAEVVAAPEASTEAAPQTYGRAVGDLLFGGVPTRAQLEALRADGFETMVTLMTDTEEGVAQALSDGRAVFGADAVIHLPAGGIPGVNSENATLLAETLAAAKKRGGKVILHCRSGARAAALYALARHQTEGLSPDDTMMAAKEAGLQKQALIDHLAELLEG